MREGERTPGPWRAERDEDAWVFEIQILGSHEHGPIIGKLNTCPRGESVIGCGGDPEANAEHIVRACNAHDALMEAAEIGLRYAEFDADAWPGTREDIERIRTALAAARGEEVETP